MKVRQVILAITFIVSLITFTLVEVIPPTQFVALSMISPLFIVFTVGVVLTIPFFIIRRNWLLLGAVLLFLVINTSDLTEYLPLDRSSGHSSQNGAQLKVLSYNVSFFFSRNAFSDAYYSPALNQQGVDIQEWIKSRNPDIICLQEYHQDRGNELFQLNKDLAPEYENYLIDDNIYNNGLAGGLIIFSKLPILKTGSILSDDFNGARFIDVLFNSDTVRFINAHLHSMRLGNPFREASFFDSSIKALRAMKYGSLIRQQQIQELVDFIDNSPYPTIVSADMNETPHGYNYHLMSDGLKDSFLEVGEGFGFTLNRLALFFLRIDYQFHTEGVKVVEFNTIRENRLSHHVPLEATYEIE